MPTGLGEAVRRGQEPQSRRQTQSDCHGNKTWEYRPRSGHDRMSRFRRLDGSAHPQAIAFVNRAGKAAGDRQSELRLLAH